jgi:hypothetical protein
MECRRVGPVGHKKSQLFPHENKKVSSVGDKGQFSAWRMMSEWLMIDWAKIFKFDWVLLGLTA